MRISKMKYNRKIIKTNENSVLYANKYWFVINQSGKVQEDGVDYYILEVTRLKKDYTLLIACDVQLYIELQLMPPPKAFLYHFV